ncbi:A24 family peptidase [Methylobacterium pseudosasicola]|uniref:Prepilin peptidase CpaA n=1 Tax=Methylobacterium pseudosasicola TaxID=582667 RepID=A0A1I4TAH6_9HYPH|nr:prepilin peptidase [Methylobacterium pseudosasicola]SFM73734.1 prepilin peptidase CpaA [Methylobacterium pseudosasicola]
MVGAGSAIASLSTAGFGLLVLFPFLMAYAAASDLLTMLIPNRISLALVAGFVLLALTGPMDWSEIGLHLGAGAAVLAVTFTLFAFGVIGGGDAKLAAATALWIGFDGLGDYLLAASIFGGALTLAILAVRAYPLPIRVARLPFALHLHDAKTGIPYGIALAAAALLVVPETEVWTRTLAG